MKLKRQDGGGSGLLLVVILLQIVFKLINLSFTSRVAISTWKAMVQDEVKKWKYLQFTGR